MLKKLTVLLGTALVGVLLLLTIIPLVWRSLSDAPSALTKRLPPAGVYHPQPGQTPLIVGTGVTSGTITVTGTVPSVTKTPSSGNPTPVLSPTSPLQQGNATVYLLGQYSSVNPVYYGTPIWIDGRAFQPGEPVTLYWNYQQPGQIVVATVTALSDGSFQYKTITPGDPNLGTVKVAAIGTVSHLLAFTATTEPADIIPNPFNAMLGSSVQVIGGGFDANEHITLLLQGMPLLTATANYLGSFSATFIVSNTLTPGNANLQAIGQSSGLHISAQAFSISLPVSIAPNAGPAGTSVTITGSHFTPSGQVSIIWNNFSGPGSNYILTNVTATSSGTFSVVVTAPLCESEGDGTICSFEAADVQTQADVFIQFPEQ